MAKKNQLENKDYTSPYDADGMDTRNPEALKYFTDTANSTANRMPSSMPVDDNGLPLTQPIVGQIPAGKALGDYSDLLTPTDKEIKLPNEDLDAIKNSGYYSQPDMNTKSMKLPNDDLDAIKTSEYDANSVAPDMGTKSIKLPADDMAAINTGGYKNTNNTKYEETLKKYKDLLASKNTPELKADEADQSQEQPEDITTDDDFAIPSQYTADDINSLMQSKKTNATPELESKQSLLDQYKALVQQRQDSNRGLGVLQGANQVAQAIASGYGAKIGDGSEAINQLRKDNELPIQGLLGQGKASDLQSEINANDPNSSISQFSRKQALNILKRQDPNMTPEQYKDFEDKFSNMTAKEIEALSKGNNSILRGGSAQLTPYQQQMMEIYKQRIGNTKDSLDFKKGAQTEKISKEDSDLAQKMQKSLDTMGATSRSQLGKAANVSGSARQLDLLLHSKPVDKFDNRDMQEIAIITNNVLTNGQTSAAGAIQKLVPSTFAGNTGKFLEFITNEPQSVDAQEFVKNFKNIADRERVAGDKALKAMLGTNIAAFYKLRERQPEIYQNIIDNKMNLNTRLNDIYRDPDILKHDTSTTEAINAEAQKTNPEATTQAPIIRKAKDGKMYKFDPITKENLGEVK